MHTHTDAHTQLTLSTETVVAQWAGGLLSVPKLNRAELVGFLFIVELEPLAFRDALQKC